MKLIILTACIYPKLCTVPTPYTVFENDRSHRHRPISPPQSYRPGRTMLAFFLHHSLQFWNEPHMSIVRIAEKTLDTSQSDWLDVLFDMWPSESLSMVAASTWMDDISADTSGIMKQWHFCDTPVFAPNFTLGEVEETYNVTSCLIDTLNSLFDPTTKNVWALHFLFRNLVHFIGDTHTPVHAASYYSPKTPDGDQGGNWIYFDSKTCTYGEPCGQLHKMWDSGVLNFQYRYIDTNSILEEFEYNISHIIAMHPPSSLPTVNIIDPKTWIQEAHDVAVNYAYGKLIGLDDPDVFNYNLQPDYISKGAQQAEILIAKAGYRLAYVIQKFFRIHNPEDPRKFTVKHLPAREIALWVIDSIVILLVIVYSILMIMDKKSGICSKSHPAYDEISQSNVERLLNP